MTDPVEVGADRRGGGRTTNLVEVGAGWWVAQDALGPDDAAPAPASPTSPPEPPTTNKIRRRRFRPAVAVVALVIGLAILAALVPGLLATHDPFVTDPANRLLGPSPAHWFGTDEMGRDVYSRVVHGSRTTILATLVAVAIGFTAGCLVGLVAGVAGGRTDAALMRLVDVLLAIPGLLLAMTVVTALGFGTINVAIAVGVGGIASFARVMRAEVMKVRSATYVEAARLGGERTASLLWRHILPNAYGPVLAMVALEFGGAVLAVSALSFLGYGVVPPQPEWGSLINSGRNYLATAWWMTMLPGLVVVAVVLSANWLGRRIDRFFRRRHE
ncbi:MAG: ABC transporter permease [Propionibacteriaceae bacterium]|jgi:peptide/nickel transport system permease protein|nr:ABC transporter permease [Propionibacteriaceae bacterium]